MRGEEKAQIEKGDGALSSSDPPQEHHKLQGQLALHDHQHWHTAQQEDMATPGTTTELLCYCVVFKDCFTLLFHADLQLQLG